MLTTQIIIVEGDQSKIVTTSFDDGTTIIIEEPETFQTIQISNSGGGNGTSGYSGYSGYSGVNGSNGSQGISGYSGYSGRSGYSGYSGYSGTTGSIGISGYSGYSGAAPSLTAKEIGYGSVSNQITGDANLVWDAVNQRIGVGTSTPTYDIDVTKNINNFTSIAITNTNSGSTAVAFMNMINDIGAALQFGQTSSNYVFGGTVDSGDSFMQFNSSIGKMVFRTIAARDMLFATNNTERMRILGSGNVKFTGSNLIFNTPAVTTNDTNLITLGDNTQTGGFVFGSTPAFSTTSGPFFAARGLNYSAFANERGSIYIAAGGVTSPVTNEGTIFFLVGTDSIAATIDWNGKFTINHLLALNNQGLSESTFLTGAVTGLKLQSQTTDQRSFLAIVPNGTSTNSDVWLFETSDTNTNFSAMAWGYESLSGYWGWNNTAGGTATLKPFYFNATGGASSSTANLKIETNGTLIANSLKTSSTAPSTTGTTKNVVSDANGQLSFVEDLSNSFGYVYQRGFQNMTSYF